MNRLVNVVKFQYARLVNVIQLWETCGFSLPPCIWWHHDTNTLFINNNTKMQMKNIEQTALQLINVIFILIKFIWMISYHLTQFTDALRAVDGTAVFPGGWSIFAEDKYRGVTWLPFPAVPLAVCCSSPTPWNRPWAWPLWPPAPWSVQTTCSSICLQ